MKKSEGKNLRKYVSFGQFDGLAMIVAHAAKGVGVMPNGFAQFADLPVPSPRSPQLRYP